MRTPREAAERTAAGYGVGNVVELEVEEDGVAALEERFKDGGTGGDE